LTSDAGDRRRSAHAEPCSSAYDIGTIAGLHYVSAKNPASGRGIAVFTDRLVPGRHLLEVIDPSGAFSQRLP
jgi:hypothetical protein